MHKAGARRSGRHGLDKGTPLTAQVLLRSQSGRRISGSVEITSSNVADYAPSAADASLTGNAFTVAGFVVGHLVGVSFSISAPAKKFESYFGCRLNIGSDGSVRVVRADKSLGYVLPLTAIPDGNSSGR